MYQLSRSFERCPRLGSVECKQRIKLMNILSSEQQRPSETGRRGMKNVRRISLGVWHLAKGTPNKRVSYQL
mgnify:CR=1 FL=1